MAALQTIAEYMAAAKGALDIIKGVRDVLPKGEAEKVDVEIGKAEKQLALSEAEVAKALGYKLCKCEFPPNIMLKDPRSGKMVCPKCHDQWPPNKPSLPEGFGRLASSRSGKDRYGRGHR